MLTQLGVAALCFSVGSSSFAAGARDERSGVLQFGGGIRAQTSIGRLTCTAGPGNAIAISLNNVGGWSSLYLTVSAPRQGKQGQAKVSLQGTGHQDNAYAIALWNLDKKVGAGGNVPIHVTANGASGSIDVKLPLVTVDDAGSVPAVTVALTWASGTCAHGTTSAAGA
jgi:hypothetical protein